MFIHDKTYDIDELAKYNTHIHTHFSRCAKPEMIVADIVKAADVNSFSICPSFNRTYLSAISSRYHKQWTDSS